MEFNKKLQELRHQRELTQEELAEALFVSRTAVSKWESGRGYPSIDSLKAIAKFFSISVDELLSGEELLGLAEENQKQKASHFRDLYYGFLDVFTALLLFLPLFAERASGIIIHVSLVASRELQVYLKVLYFVVIIFTTAFGILMLALQNLKARSWIKTKAFISLSLSAVALFIFIISLQAYAGIFTFALIVLKAIILIKSE